MGDFVDEKQVERIRAHYRAYQERKMTDPSFERSERDNNRSMPESLVYDASTFREVSTYYINRLLRYIEVEDMIAEFKEEEEPHVTALLEECIEEEHALSPKAVAALTALKKIRHIP
jgi:hypothetical protein